jgi:hypothetical protein
VSLSIYTYVSTYSLSSIHFYNQPSSTYLLVSMKLLSWNQKPRYQIICSTSKRKFHDSGYFYFYYYYWTYLPASSFSCHCYVWYVYLQNHLTIHHDSGRYYDIDM